MEPEILISWLNHYDYCPRRFYYIAVEGSFIENEHTLEGRLLHQRADSGVISHRGETAQYRSIWLTSDRWGLVGKADVIEGQEGRLHPVEVKKGPRGDWRNDTLQLCAQALCLEEMRGLSDPITRGFIFYAATGRRREVVFDDLLRSTTVRTIGAVREMLRTGERPPNGYGPRCKGCSLRPECLPIETALVRAMADQESPNEEE